MDDAEDGVGTIVVTVAFECAARRQLGVVLLKPRMQGLEVGVGHGGLIILLDDRPDGTWE